MFKKVFVLCFSANKGGMELDAIRMSRRISEYADVTLIGLKGSYIEALAKQDISQGRAYRFESCSVSKFWARVFIDFRLAFLLRTVAKKINPDMVIFLGTSEIKTIGFALRGMTSKLVLRIGTTINTPKKSLAQQFFYKKVDSFLVISEHLKHNTLNSFPIATSRPVEICYPVINIPESQPKVLRDDLCRIVYHSRFVKGKGQKDALLAFESVFIKNPKLRLKLIGLFEDEAYVSEIKEYILLKGLQNYVDVIDNQEDISSILHESDIFLGPSYGEGFSNSFVEALAYGLICVTYENTAFPHFQKMGFNFFMAITGSLEDLQKSLSKALLAFYEKSVDLESNKQLCQKLFSVESEKRVLYKIYDQMIHVKN